MSIDTSTTFGKVKVMQAHLKGRSIQKNHSNSDKWIDVDIPEWHWFAYDFRIKPQTVEDAAEKYEIFFKNLETLSISESFRAGAKWKENQSK